MKFSHTFQLMLLAGSLSALAHASTVFNFDNDNVGTATKFTDTVNGLSATFSSPSDPGGFVIYQNNGLFETLTGNVLGDPGPAGLDNLPLTINLSANLSAVTLNFATSDFGAPSPFTLTAFEGTTQVGSVSSAGINLAGFTFPEGQIAFVGKSPFNSIVLSSTAPDFAIDNVTAVTAAPEPSSSVLLGLGLALFAVGTVRRGVGRRQRIAS